MKIRVSDMGESGLHIKTFRKPEWLTNIPELSSDEGGNHLSSNINFDLFLNKEYLPKEKDEDIDFETYKGDEIDLGGYLRELIAMSLPIKVLCVQECKGLCPNCGVNLNLEECSCKDNWVDPRFAVLRNLKV